MPQSSSPLSAVPYARKRIDFREAIVLAIDSFRADRIRATMTSLGMVIGTTSLILVVTIALTGKRYVLSQIQSIGTNLIWLEYSGVVNAGANASVRDYITVDDMRAVQSQVPGIQAASPVLNLHERMSVGGGKEKDMLILGVNPEYVDVRRLQVRSGRFFDQQDAEMFSKAALVTVDFAQRRYGGVDEALGKELKIVGLPFVIIGTFRESVETFGQSEIQNDTVLIPYPVARQLTATNAVNQIYFSAYDTESVPYTSREILRVVKSRHRPESVYDVGNLTQALSLAEKTANTSTVVLLLFAAVTLMVGGVGIMNIMLATVTARIREIGIRKAVGATRREIALQFLTEAVMISMAGGLVGILIGLGLPFSVRFFTDYRIPIPGLAAFIALFVSCSVGVVFGTVPANRAARLDPVECLRHE